MFAEHGLNMRKLESRPSRERAWEYVFWVDLDADAARPGDGRRARRSSRAVTTMVRVLGSYPRGTDADGLIRPRLVTQLIARSSVSQDLLGRRAGFGCRCGSLMNDHAD